MKSLKNYIGTIKENGQIISNLNPELFSKVNDLQKRLAENANSETKITCSY